MCAILCSLAFKEAVWHETTDTILTRTWQQKGCHLMTIHSFFNNVLNVPDARDAIFASPFILTLRSIPGFLLCGHQFREERMQAVLKIKIDLLAASQGIGTELEAMWV